MKPLIKTIFTIFLLLYFSNISEAKYIRKYTSLIATQAAIITMEQKEVPKPDTGSDTDSDTGSDADKIAADFTRKEVAKVIKEIDETLRDNCQQLGRHILDNYELEEDLIEKLRTDEKFSELMFSTNNKIKLEILEPKLGKELRKITMKI